MRRTGIAALLGLVLIVFGTSLALARGVQDDASDLVMGAQIYDKWYAALGVEAPAGDMPVWRRQSTNTRSGADTWRCSECHGWDYRGVDGAYASGSHKTGFPSLLIVTASLTQDEIVAHLKGANDEAHDFSVYLDEASMQKVAFFLKEGLIDDTTYIDSASLKVVNGSLKNGRELFKSTCEECHGADGRTIVFRSEGIDEYLGDVAHRDPYRFLHRTRFGVAGTQMPVMHSTGWTPADGRDVLMYAQTLPTAHAAATVGPAGEGSEPPQQIGGPGSNWIAGIFTGILAALGIFTSAVLFLSVLVIIGVVVVFLLRRRK